MPNTREKLIALLYNFHLDTNGHICDGCGIRSAEQVCAELADHLIANGVTVQKWIPVTERLPEDNSDVLAYMQNGTESRIFPASYYKDWWEDCILNTRCLSVTHWMPLPEPPKGE